MQEERKDQEKGNANKNGDVTNIVTRKKKQDRESSKEEKNNVKKNKKKERIGRIEKDKDKGLKIRRHAKKRLKIKL
uniref:Uncharacterized protein n=1 Tax=Romanomermis culicivorax TaxID=13658 RepID=A0A915L2R1_ROMCU